MLGRFHDTAANERRASDLCGVAYQTSRVLLATTEKSNRAIAEETCLKEPRADGPGMSPK
jgi:hypothetical protein